MKSAFIALAIIMSSSSVFAFPTKQCPAGQFVINGRCATIPEALRKTEVNPLEQAAVPGDYVNTQGVIFQPTAKCPDQIIHTCYVQSQGWENFQSCYKSCESAMTDAK